MKFLFYILCFFIFVNLSAKIIYVGANEAYNNLQEATKEVVAGDTILIRGGIYNGGMYIENLRAEGDEFIYIIGENGATISGGNNAIQLSEARSLSIENIIFEKQKYNGVNIDDGGTYETPSTRILFKSCTFRDMDASGNNDLLKLSGLDTFAIENCIFENGAAGGSGIDMVGCHYGRIESNTFKNMGSNAIQAKGGTQFILIQRNHFENCGQRTLNLGGSTGLDFFRPIDAKFEAADIAVWSNIIIGSISPINYVGSIRIDVTNNTIIKPEKWVIRILQETVDESRFYKCSQSTFNNNIIYLGNLGTETNIGPNTAPETFTFNNNFWFNYENENWHGPYLPTAEINQKNNIDPIFEDVDLGNYKLKSESKAIGYISGYSQPQFDFYGKPFSNPRSAGAIESITTGIIDNNWDDEILIYPNPAMDYITINLSVINRRVNPTVDERGEDDGSIGACSNENDIWASPNASIEIYNMMGVKIHSSPSASQPPLKEGNLKIDISNLSPGVYFVNIVGSNGACSIVEKFLKF